MKNVLRVACLLFVCSPLYAAVHIWSGANSERFADAGNWIGGSPDGDASADLLFPAALSRTVLTNDLPALAPRSIEFAGNGYVINGNAITLNASTISSSMTLATINCELRLSGEVTLNSLSGTQVNTLALNGLVSGGGSLKIAGGGFVSMSGTTANTYTGGTRVVDGVLMLAKRSGVTAIPGPLTLELLDLNRRGVLTLAASEQIADKSAVTMQGTTVMRMNGFSETIGSLTLAASTNIGTTGRLTVTGPIAILAASSLTNPAEIDAELFLTSSKTITCPSSAFIPLKFFNVKGVPGAGITLSGCSTGSTINGSYSGPTILYGSRVAISNPSTAVTANGGSIITSGSVGSLTSVASNITIETVARDLTLDSRSTFNHSSLGTLVSGAVTLGGATLIDTFAGTYVRGVTHTVIDNRGSGPVNGTFGGVPEGGTTQSLQITYHGGDGNDVVATDQSKYTTSITLNDPQPANITVGDSGVTLSGFLTVAGNGVPPISGTITLRDTTNILATIPAKAGAFQTTSGAFSFAGTRTIVAEYSGDANYKASNSGARLITVAAKTAVISNITPSTIRSGVPTEITIDGDNFAPDAVVGSSVSINFTSQFVSSKQLKATINFIPNTVPGTVTLYVKNQNSPKSNDFAVTFVRDGDGSIAFDTTKVTGKAAVGSTTYWLTAGNDKASDNVIADSNRDGIVEWNVSPTAETTWAMVDSTGKFDVEGYPNPHGQIPSPVFELGPDGNLSRMVVSGIFTRLEVLWVRPGIGAWRATLDDGAATDADVPDYFNARAVFLTSGMHALGSTLTPPPAFADGDVVVVLVPRTAAYAAMRLSNPTPPVGSGSVDTANRSAAEGFPLRVWFYRGGGSDGTISVDYATADGTAIAGLDYQSVSGTVTFAPGEYLKSIEIPTIADSLFAGSRTVKMNYTPHDTTVKVDAVALTIFETSPKPVANVSGTYTVNEGSDGIHTTPVVVTLTGTPRAPAVVSWQTNGFRGSQNQPGLGSSGLITFSPGETMKTIDVPWNGNDIPEADQRFVLTLSTPIGADNVQIAKNATATINVIDDDQNVVSAGDATVTDGNDGPRTATISVRLNGPAVRMSFINYATSDGTAMAGSDYVASSGTITFQPGESVKTVTLQVTGDHASEPNEIFLVTLSQPVSLAIGRASSIVTIVDDDGGAAASVGVNDVQVNEVTNNAAALFTVELSSAAASSVSVDWSTSDVTAKSGSDYTAASGTLTFAPGETKKTVSISILSDTTSEDDETFALNLSNAHGVALGRSRAIATIIDDDRLPVITINDTSVIETNGFTTAVFDVTLSKPAPSPVTLHYATGDGTALASSDYVAAQGDVTIPIGELEGKIYVIVNGDTATETNETFFVHLSQAANATIGRDTAQGTIIDDDVPRHRVTHH